MAVKQPQLTQYFPAYRLLRIADLCFKFEQLNKFAALCARSYSEHVGCLKGKCLQVTSVENDRAAWSMSTFIPATKQRLLTLILLAANTLALCFLYFKRQGFTPRIGLAVLVGGALGNFIVRLQLHYVIGYIHVDLGLLPIKLWPAFHIIDMATFSGTAFIIFHTLVSSGARQGARI